GRVDIQDRGCRRRGANRQRCHLDPGSEIRRGLTLSEMGESAGYRGRDVLLSSLSVIGAHLQQYRWEVFLHPARLSARHLPTQESRDGRQSDGLLEVGRIVDDDIAARG